MDIRRNLVIALLLLSGFPALAANKSTQSPITMEQLMGFLHIQGGNFVFEFDTPVYARITVLTTDYPRGKKETVQYFDTANPNQKIELYFTASPFSLGEVQDARVENYWRMVINLSGCKEASGIQIVYVDKFSGNAFYKKDRVVGQRKPDVPAVPKTNEDYILHWYYGEGDPYQAKATIRFSTSPFKKQ